MTILFGFIALLFLVWVIFNASAVLLVGLYNSRQKNKLKKKPAGGGTGDTAPSDHLKSQNSQEAKKRGFNYSSVISGLNKYVCRKTSQIPSHTIRMFVIKYVLKCDVEKDVVVYGGTILRGAHKIKIDNGTIIGDDCILDGRGGLVIGSDCNLSTGVRIWTAQHDVQSENFAYQSASVSIGDHCWISGGTTILPGVMIGRGCVIASGAVVTKDCEEKGIYAGIPAKRIGEREIDLNYHFNGSHDWFY